LKLNFSVIPKIIDLKLILIYYSSLSFLFHLCDLGVPNYPAALFLQLKVKKLVVASAQSLYCRDFHNQQGFGF